LNGLFFNCSSLISLPDISKWNKFSSNIYNYISYLNSKYYYKDEEDIKQEFELSLFSKKSYNNDLYLEKIDYKILEPKSYTKKEIKKLYLSHSYNMNGLFARCSSLKYLPNISKWNLENAKDIS